MTESFLGSIAKRYYEEISNSQDLFMDKVCFVFPNRRAGIFFKKELQKVIVKPQFSPKIYAVNELFMRYSDLRQADSVELIFALYDVYKNHVAEPLSVGDFVTLGSTMLKDFDEMDKYMVDVELLFKNVDELNKINADYLSEEQKEQVARFWGHLMPSGGSDKLYNMEFVSLWGKLFTIYSEFKKKLKNAGVAYDGMIFRAVAEGIDDVEIEYDRYVFVGFNGLNKTEEILLKSFRTVGDYYFDYPQFIRDMGEAAGAFCTRNKQLFGEPRYDIDADVLVGRKKVKIFGVPSNVGQVQLLPRILDSMPERGRSIDTVVVLPDEGMLVPVVRMLPDCNDGVNITMGYPLEKTPIALLITKVIALHKNVKNGLFYYKNVLSVLKHPYLMDGEKGNSYGLIEKMNRGKLIYVGGDELLEGREYVGSLEELIFAYDKTTGRWDSFVDYVIELVEMLYEKRVKVREDDDEDVMEGATALDREYMNKYLLNLHLIKDNVQRYGIVDEEDIFGLLSHLTQISNVPFRGEPVEGLQVMGALECRLLDFKNVIILSFNDEKIPRSQNFNSLIPHNLRRAYELPTVDYNDKLYSYNFYRMLHRAENVYMVYDARIEGVQKNNEISRYYYQMKYLYVGDFEIEDVDVSYRNNSVNEHTAIDFDKKGRFIQSCLGMYAAKGEEVKFLSPSLLNDYIDCPLKFLLQNIYGLREDAEISEEADMAELGTVFHDTMEAIYEPWVGCEVNAKDIDGFDLVNIERVVDENIKKTCKSRDISGVALLNRVVVMALVKKTLEYDKGRAPFYYVASEKKIVGRMSVALNDGKEIELNIKGKVDRMDEKDGELYVIDYKTGNMDGKMNVESLEAMFDGSKKRAKEVFQTLLYCYLLENIDGESRVMRPHIYVVKEYDKTDMKFKGNVEKKDLSLYVKEIMPEFEERFKALVADIFDDNVPFSRTENEKTCEYCKYGAVCGK